MSVHKVKDGLYKIRWREGGHNRSQSVHGGAALAAKVLRKKMTARDENRHLDIRKDVNFRVSELIDRYIEQYGSKKSSADREKASLKAFGQSWAICSSGKWTA